MKHIIVVLFSLLLLSAPAVVQAQFSVSTNADGTLTIVSYTGPPGAIVIPTNINGLTVTVVGNGSSIFPPSSIETSVSIPETVVSFGINAFAGGGYFITNLNVPSGLTNIGAGAFDGCGSLPSITIPSNITDIGPYTFASCSSLTNILIPEGVTNIGSSAFEYCTSLGSITIPVGVAQIPAASASGTQVEGEVFQGCTNLTNLIILGNPIIGEYAFNESSLQSVYIAGGVVGARAFESCTNLTNLTLGDGVTSIGAISFDGDPISDLVIPASVTNIGGNAFEGDGLTNLVIPDGVTYIGTHAFLGNLLSSLYIPGSVTNIDDQAFFDCARLTNVIIAAGVSSISAAAFAGCPLSSVFCLGNAPAIVGLPGDGPVFLGDDNAIVFYMPGTTGWSNTIGWNDGLFSLSGAPTALWNPVIQASGPNFGVSNGQFGFNMTGNSNLPIAVDACTNLGNPVWTPLTNMTLTNGSVYFSDPNWTNFPVRYYGIGFS
jgi:hypothetical protein